MKTQIRATLRKTTIALSLLGGNQAIMAYETSWFDKKVDEKEAISSFKADGTIFAGFERADYEKNGVLEPGGTRPATSTGFIINRAYLNLRGDVNEGPWKGANFRVTVDAGVLGNNVLGTTNSTTSTGNSAQVAELKFAYFSLPLYTTSFGDGSVRIGQQNVAIVDGQAGYSNESYWKHRYIDQNAVEKSGFAGGSADRGISFIHKADYFGLHLMLSNGEAFRRNNAQFVFNPTGSTGAVNVATTGVLTAAQQTQVRTSLTNLVNGNNGTTNDSYGYDLYGIPSFHPTGKAKDIDISIGLPFRLQNTTGIKRQEYEFLTADISTINSPRFDYYKGDARAKQDTAFGQELAAAFDFGDLKFTIGAGHALLKDKRSSAFRIDQNGLNTLVATQGSKPFVDYTTFYQADQDAYGQTNWGYIHARFLSFGFIARQIYGTGSGTISALPKKSYLQQLAEVDIRDGNIGNGDVTLAASRGSSPSIDLGKARFKRETYALTWNPFARLSVALGVEKLKSKDKNGETTKVTNRDNIATCSTTTTTLSTQVNSYLATQGAPLVANDFGGKEKENKQVFIRAQYEF